MDKTHTNSLSMRISLGVFCVVLLALNACTSATPTIVTVEEQGTGQTAVPQPEPQSDDILYAENFDKPDNLSGWDSKLDEKSTANPQDGAYRLGVDGGMAALIQRQQSFTDAVIEVDVQFLGPDPARAGVLCRNETGNYAFVLSSNGDWTIESSGKSLANGQASVQSGVNHLTVSCVGNQLGFTLNGTTLGIIQDDAFQQGQIGFTLDSNGKAEVLFDNLTVRRPLAQAAEIAPTQVAIVEPATPTHTPIATATPAPTATSTTTSAPTLTPTPAATLRPTVIPEAELILYQTDFDDGDQTLADWVTFAYSMDTKALVTEGYQVNTVNGYYRTRTTNPEQDPNLRIFSIYDKDIDTADVDIALLSNTQTAGNIGLVCRYSKAGWYQFAFEPGGWTIRLAKYDEAGQLHFYMLSNGGYPWTAGVYTKTMRAECKGDRLTLYIDDVKYASLHDNTFLAGKVGLLGWSFPVSGEIGIGMKPGDVGMVDNFTVRRAQWNETGLPGPAPTPGTDGVIYTTDFGRLDDLNPYWAKVDIGVQGIPGSPVLVGGPGQGSPHTYQYINDFDPGPDIEITADVRGKWNYPHGLICRYSEDGWYETFYMKDSGEYARVALVLGQRDEQGKLMRYIMDTYYPPTAASQITLTLTCAGNQISVKVNGEQVLYAEDNTWTSGRYGLFFTDNPPGNLRNTLLNYTVHPMQPIPAGAFVDEKVFTSPEEIAANWGLDLQNNPMIKVEENVLLLDADDGIGLTSNSGTIENSEMSMDVEFLDSGVLYLQCRSESPAHTMFEVRNNGEWFLQWQDREIARGSSPAIQPGKNVLTMRCEGERLTLIANGETIAEETYHAEYTPTQGKVVLWVNAQLRVNSIAFKIFQGSPILTVSPLLNQVALPPSYQPGETIFAWDIDNFLSGCGGGWWGRDPSPCWWTRAYGTFDQEHRNENAVLVTPNERILTLFTYRPDLYDQPIEISADATLTSKGGGVALFCRATTSGRYEFLLQPDGKWYIRRNVIAGYYLPKAKHLTTLAHGTVESFSPENAQMRAICSGSDLIFVLNGVELGRVQDTLYPEGQAGILFDVFSEGSFTNLMINRAK